MSQFYIMDRSCYRRREEVGLVRRFLVANSWTEAERLGEADAVVFFACAGLRYLAEEKLAEIQATRHRLKPGAELIVGSCLPDMERDRLRAVFGGSTISPTDLGALNQLPHIHTPVEAMPPIWGPSAVGGELERPSPAKALRMRFDDTLRRGMKALLASFPSPSLKRAVVRLQRRHTASFSVAAGCSGKCTYCAKPFASGRVRSKPMDLVLDKLTEGIRLGYRAFDLYADSLGGYGRDQGTDLGQLLDRIGALPHRFSIGLFDVRPEDFLAFFEPILRLAKADRLHYLHVAVQSGNPRILRRMNRPCDVELLAARLAEIRQYRQIFMQSGIIAGFPGETDEEFQDTLRLLRRADFDDVYVHYYCEMPNTPASALPDKVDKASMRLRLDQVQASGIRFDPAATRHEWECNLAYPD